MTFTTAIYAGLLGLLSIAVAFPAGTLRGKLNIPLGDGGNAGLLLAMRRHANFVEWVPLALILIGLLEVSGVAKVAIHVMGASLVVFRVCHALGFKGDTMRSSGRFVGAMGTALLVVIASVWLLLRSF
jgi:hypothetical protein